MVIISSKHQIDGREVEILVEAEQAAAPAGYDYGEGRDQAPAARIIHGARNIFGEGLDLIENCARAIVSKITALKAAAPDEFEVNLAVKLDAAAGALIAKTSAEAQLAVKLTWKKLPQSQHA